MRSRAFRPVAAMLSILMLTSVPVDAGQVTISEVVQVLGTYQNPPTVRLRSLTQSGSTPISDIVNSGVQQSGYGSGANADGTVAPNATGSLLSGLANDPQRGVEIIDQGEVEGTICDCGDILIPGAFPKWPLLFLAAIPLFFINTGDDIEVLSFNPTPTPSSGSNPTPTPTPEVPIPEPGSLLLFGSGLAVLGAGLRRRYATAKLAAQISATREA